MTHEPPRPPLADWWSRVGATLIDWSVAWGIAIVAVISSALTTAVFGAAQADGRLLLFAFVLGSVVFNCALMARRGPNNGQTLGKQAVGIRVVRADGRPVGLGLALVREGVLKTVVSVALLGIGWLIDALWPLADRQNRALHDLAVGTRVIGRPVAPARVAPQQLAPEIARHVYAARTIEARIREAVQRAQLPYPELAREVDLLVTHLYESAHRAQLLYNTLAEAPVARIEGRLAELEHSGKTELIDALRAQLTVQRRMQAQYERYSDEMERVVVELDTIRGSVVSVSVSSHAPSRQRLAEQVRELRDELSSVADGMSEAYD